MTKERSSGYVGLSGVVGTDQKYSLLEHFAHAGFEELPDNRKLALGVKAVDKTLRLGVENKYVRDWYPVGEEAFSNVLDEGGTETLQVAQVFFDAELVYDEGYRDEFIERVRRCGKGWLNAVQFDLLPWHADKSMLPWLEKVKEESGLTILLQAHGEAMGQLGPNRVAQKLGHYAHALDYILFDASHGKGMRMNAEALKPFLYAGYNSTELDGVGFSVAGGLNAEVVRQDLPALIEDYPGISWDAEGQLHPALDDGTRPLSAARSVQYLNASAEILYERYRRYN